MRDDSYFGYRIFAPPRATAAPRIPKTQQMPPAPLAPSIAQPSPAPAVVAQPDAAALAAKIAKIESLLTLYGDLQRLSRARASIDVSSHLSHRDFYDQYYCRNRPVILQGLLAGSEAVRKWSPEFFATHAYAEQSPGPDQQSEDQQREHRPQREDQREC